MSRHHGHRTDTEPTADTEPTTDTESSADNQHGRDNGHGNHSEHGHGSGHHHTDLDWEVMAAWLEDSGDLHLPVLRQVAARLRRPGVRRVLDIGSGPGVMTGVLAETFPDAEVVAVDGAAGLLDRALARAERLGLGGRVSVQHAELPEGLAGLGSADLIWSSKAVHHLGDQQATLTALAGALNPGGVLAVAEGGLPTRFLPRDIGVGRPGLQARLDAAQEEWFEAMRTGLPGSVAVVEDWPAMLTRAGLTDAGSFTSLLDLPAPLGEPGRAFLHTHLSRLRGNVSEAFAPEDLDTLDVLLDPTSAEGILRRPDAFLLSATTVFTGVRPAH
ncbi:class I SAM-dependent methyltransferase [Actinokineospora sp. NBRC 105648]|uniref:class I SAM-dependent methyltransferase n=1 Tax=Actinokineospora sp. NBRC 105648 TaxID=3032206 RepID=UPI0025547C73|nr:class I SAM-dependent methyltransferase [Actinokineospora sp. NBRC 105648]